MKSTLFEEAIWSALCSDDVKQHEMNFVQKSVVLLLANVAALFSLAFVLQKKSTNWVILTVKCIVKRTLGNSET